VAVLVATHVQVGQLKQHVATMAGQTSVNPAVKWCQKVGEYSAMMVR